MQEKIRTIRLYGQLGAKFGRLHKIAVNSTREAIRALCVLVPGFEAELMQSHGKGIGYACFLGKRNLNEEQLADPIGKNDIRIAPIIIGSKRGGLLQILAGVALVGASLFTGGAALGLGASMGTVAGSSLGGTLGGAAGMLMGGSGLALGTMGWLGVSLALGGVAQLLSPQQKGIATKDGAGNSPSYNFNGPVNMAAEGNPVPIAYGRVLIGGATASGGIFAENRL